MEMNWLYFLLLIAVSVIAGLIIKEIEKKGGPRTLYLTGKFKVAQHLRDRAWSKRLKEPRLEDELKEVYSPYDKETVFFVLASKEAEAQGYNIAHHKGHVRVCCNIPRFKAKLMFRLGCYFFDDWKIVRDGTHLCANLEYMTAADYIISP